MLKAAAPTRSHTAVRAGGGVRTHAKGEQTRAEIVAVALAMAARVGLEGLSIGTLADLGYGEYSAETSSSAKFYLQAGGLLAGLGAAMLIYLLVQSTPSSEF